jgi:hypothetical protein
LSKRPSAPLAGIVGAAAGFACVVITTLIIISISSSADPSLVAALIPLALAFCLVVAIVVSLANGILWYYLVHRGVRWPILWMGLSLVGALAAPGIALFAIITVRSIPTLVPPEANEIFCCCGIPGAIAGLILLTYWLSSRRPGAARATPDPDGGQRVAPITGEPGGSGGRFVPFALGLTISTLTAAVMALLFGIILHTLSQRMAALPPSSGGFMIDLSGLDLVLYMLLALVVSAVLTLVVSLALTAMIVAPRMASTTVRIVTPILFSVLSLILNLLLDGVLVLVLFEPSG